ncbi:MAG: hypothetical protein WDO18_01010 [Acidobacteriota bacterium]
MNDESRKRAVTGGLFEFVGPATVISEGLAGEEFRIVRRGLTGEEHDDLALHVDALVVVPLILRRDDAVADEDRGTFELDVRLLPLCHADEIFEPAECDGRPGRGNRAQLRTGLRSDADKLELLKIRPVVAHRLRANQRELGGDVIGGEIAAWCARAAAFEKVAGKELYVRANAFARNLRHLRLRRFRASGQYQQPRERSPSHHQRTKPFLISDSRI